MSGTSADGVDVALVDFHGDFKSPKWKLINSISFEYPSFLQKRIISVEQGAKLSSDEWLKLSETITECHFDAAHSCDPKGLAKIVGCHGQTVFHRPPKDSCSGASLQLIQAPLLSILLNRTVIYDFRAKDLALGGEGAPLLPLLDAALIGRGCCWRAVLNLGGIANLSLIPPRSGPDSMNTVMGWDCGPANTLLDLAAQQITNGRLKFDVDGLLAANGTPDCLVIEEWLKEAFFQLLPPKSSGREQFGIKDLEKRLKKMNPISENDLMATLTRFTASIVAQDLDNLYKNKFIRPVELFVAGGGSKNPVLMKEIVNCCLGMRVLSTKEVGIPEQFREAIGFALLAWWNINQYPCDNKSITGSKRASILGALVNPQ